MVGYDWKITLPNNEVVYEKDQAFDLAWEEPGAVLKFELIGDKQFEVDLKSGGFNIDGVSSKPKGVTVTSKKLLYFRKRRQVRITPTGEKLSSQTKYLFGYTINGKTYTASIQPAIDMAEEEITKPE